MFFFKELGLWRFLDYTSGTNIYPYKTLPVWHYFYWVLFYFSTVWVLQIIRENAAGCCLSKDSWFPFYKNVFFLGHGESRECLVARGRGFWRLWVLNNSGRRVSWVQNCIFSVDYKITDNFISCEYMHGCMIYTVSVPTNQH